nr:hypothetical protein [Tanacetum cinerariifolium]
MKLALRARNKFIFVDGSCLKESYATSNVLFAQWDTCSAIVLTWHMNYVSQDVYMGFVYYDNAASFLKELKSGSSVADYYHRLNSLRREFDALIKLPKYVCEVKYSFDASSELVLYQQLMKLMHFLIGLDDCYQPIRSALLTRDSLRILKYAYTTVSKEETHRGIPESSSVSEYTLNATSFDAKSFNKNKRNFNNNRGFTLNNNINRGPNPSINYKIRHTIDKCFEIIGFSPGFKRNTYAVKQCFIANNEVKLNDKQSSFSLSSGFTSEQIQKLLSLINDTSTGNIHANMVVDITSLNISIGHPNGTLATIIHVGNLKLFNNVVLYDVLVVLGYCVSLLFVNKLIRDSKMYVGR